jgi:hypothetical protein
MSCYDALNEAKASWDKKAAAGSVKASVCSWRQEKGDMQKAMKVQETGSGLYRVANGKTSLHMLHLNGTRQGQEGNFMLDNKLFTSIKHSCYSLHFADKVC